MKRKFLFIVLIMWMSCIFVLSSQNSVKSAKTSASFIKSVVQVVPKVKQMNEIEKNKLIGDLQYCVRKLTHFFIYALGGIIVTLWLCTYNIEKKKIFLIAVLFCMAYATSDEIHQIVVPGRSGELRDVIIDTCGASIGSGIIFACTKLKRDNKKKAFIEYKK